MARVARRRFDDRATGAQQAAPLRVLDHPDADPVLHGAAGVQHLELRQDRRLEAARHGVQPDERRVAERVQEGVHHHPIATRAPSGMVHIVPRRRDIASRVHGPRGTGR
jgi:hypothetical protein